jgi:hypothetical protein
MKIGLVRHFKVQHPFPSKALLSKSDVIDWFVYYDATENVQFKNVDLHDIEWTRCYSSPMARALQTARHIYQGKIVQAPELAELAILHRLPGRIKLPFLVWGLLVRIKSFSSNKDTQNFKQAIADFVDSVIAKNEGDVLIVSHWFVMREIRQVLIKRGFTGDDFRSNEYGVLYVFSDA